MGRFDRKKWLSADTFISSVEDLPGLLEHNRRTDEMWREQWTANIEANWPVASKGEWVSKIYGQFRGNCMIVGPGPSLMKNIRQVWAARHTGVFVICLDRAYATLKAHGIIPNLVVTADAQEEVKEFFNHIDKRTVVAMCIAQHPSVYQKLKEKGVDVVWYSIATPFSEFWAEINKKYGDWIAMVRSGASVMFCACDIAIHMGFGKRAEKKTIMTVGNDCCWYSAEEAAADGHDRTLEPHDGKYTIAAYVLTADSMAMFPYFHQDVDFRDLSGGLEKAGWAFCVGRVTGAETEESLKAKKLTTEVISDGYKKALEAVGYALV